MSRGRPGAPVGSVKPRERSKKGTNYLSERIEIDDPMAVMAQNRDKVRATPWVLQHRLVMARSLGRPLESYESVHHRNGDRHDNRIENLQLRVGNHGIGAVAVCRCCGSSDIEFGDL